LAIEAVVWLLRLSCRTDLKEGGKTIGSIVWTGTYIEKIKDRDGPKAARPSSISKVHYLVHW
jgi:hypothetical protein